MQPEDHKNALAILLGAAFYGFITVGGKYFSDVGYSLYEIALLVVFAAIPLLPFLIIKKYRIRKAQLRFFLMFGLIGALLQLSQFAGIVLGMPVAIVALLLYTQPIWTIGFSKWFLNEKITPRKLAAAALALLGIMVLLNPFAIDVKKDFVGIIASVLAGLLLSLWVICGRRSGLRNQHIITTTFGYAFFSGVWLLLFHPLFSQLITDSQFTRLDFTVYQDYFWSVAAFAVFAQVVPACLVFWGMQKIEASTAGILLLLEPVSAALLAWFIFQEPLTANIWFGGGLILFANYVLFKK